MFISNSISSQSLLLKVLCAEQQIYIQNLSTWRLFLLPEWIKKVYHRMTFENLRPDIIVNYWYIIFSSVLLLRFPGKDFCDTPWKPFRYALFMPCSVFFNLSRCRQISSDRLWCIKSSKLTNRAWQCIYLTVSYSCLHFDRIISIGTLTVDIRKNFLF